MRRLAWRITAVIMLVSIMVAPLLYVYSTSVSSGYYIEPVKWSYTVNVTYSNYTSGTNTTYTYNYGVYPNVTSITNGTTSSQMVSNDIWNRSLYMLPSNQQTISNNVWNRYVQLLPSNQQTISNNIWNRSVLAKPNTGAYCTPAILNYTIYNNLDHNINGFALYLNSTTFPYWDNLTGLFPFETRYLVVTDMYGEHLHYWIPYLDEYNEYGFIVVKMGVPAHSYTTILLHFCDNTYDSRYDTPEGVALYGYNFTSGDKLDNYWSENGSGSYDIVGGLLRMSASDGGGWYGLTMSKAFTGEGYVLALVTDGLYMDGNRGGNNTLFTGFIQDGYFPSGTGGASNTILGTVSRIGLGEGDKDWGLQLETADGSNSNVLDSDNTQQNNLYFDKLLVWSIYYNSSMTIGQVTGETTDSNTNPFVNRTFSTLPVGSLQPLIAVEDSSSDGATLGLEMNGLYIVAYPILDNITVTENASQESSTPAYPCYTSILKTTSTSITGGTVLTPHTKKWIFNDNQSYIEYSNNITIPLNNSNVTYPYELAYYEETSNGTVTFLSDPSWVNSEGLYVDIVGGYTGTPYGNVTVEDDSPSLWVVNGLYNDSLVHVLYMDKYYHNHYLMLIDTSNDRVLYAYKITSDNIVIDPPSGSYVLAVGDPEPCTSGGGGGGTGSIIVPGGNVTIIVPSVNPPGINIGNPGIGNVAGVITLVMFMGLVIVFSRVMPWYQALAVGSSISLVLSIILLGVSYISLFVVLLAMSIAFWKSQG